MKRVDVVAAASMVQALDKVKALRATIKRGKYELRLYALAENETMHDEIAVTDKSVADMVIGRIMTELEERLKSLGVDR